MRRRLLTGLLLSTFAAAPAAAEEGVDRPGFIRFDAGLLPGLALGRVSAGYAPVRAVEIEAGLGAGVVGWTLSTGVHGAAGHGRTRFLVGAAMALSFSTSWSGDPNRGLWLGGDLGLEHVFPGGLVLSATAGVQHILLGCGSDFSGENPDDECDDSPFESGELTTVALGLSVGYRFYAPRRFDEARDSRFLTVFPASPQR